MVIQAKRWIPGVVITLFLATAAALQFVGGPEEIAYTIGAQLLPQRPARGDVAVVGIGAAALREYGAWPWPRSVLAKCIRRLAADRARVIAFVPRFEHPQNTLALDFLHKVAALDAVRKDTQAAMMVAQAQTALATDRTLASSIQSAGNVVLAAYGAPHSGGDAPTLPAWFVYRMSVPFPDTAGVAGMIFSPVDVAVHLPLTQLAQAADGIGYLSTSPPRGLQPLLVNVGGALLPSLSLQVAARDLGLQRRDIVPHDSGGISLGNEYLFTDAHMQVRARPDAGGSRDTIPIYGFDAVQADTVPAADFTDKAVIIGLTAGRPNPRALAVAERVAGILDDSLVATPFWAWWLRGLLTLVVGAYLLLMVPRLGTWLGVAVSTLIMILLVNGEFIPLISHGLWLPLTLPMLFLIIGHGALLTTGYLRKRLGVSRGELSETNRQLALACQTLGRFDDALRHYGGCLPTPALYENLLSLGHEHERHRRYPQAAEVYVEMKRLVAEFGDVEDRLQKLQALDNQTTLTRKRGPHINLTDNGLQKPVLGRYELVKELGRGAMSVVYLGRDQKINRIVAIKTLSFRDEFEGTVPEEISRRFFSEAETAGRLNHPNIVTIYDIGEDQGLAYIAMDYLRGTPLQPYALPGALLPLDEVMAIIIKIAEALDYAHGRQVVHRDIKPANIMYDRETGQLKVTDFGVASLVNVTRTRTGTILGSPSYMSPEQVAGKKVDGRSDLYSLGVTLYQLLRGELPFEAPSLTGLMFKVSNTPPPDVTFLRPDIPPALKDAVERALEKSPDARFQTGKEMALAIGLCRGRVPHGR